MVIALFTETEEHGCLLFYRYNVIFVILNNMLIEFAFG